jgi:hypothetical protein
VILEFHSWFTPLQALALVANPHLKLRHTPLHEQKLVHDVIVLIMHDVIVLIEVK